MRLGWYIIALLIVDTFLMLAIIRGNLSPQAKSACLLAGCLMFILVIAAVTVLLWFRPTHVTLGSNAHQITSAGRISDVPATMVERLWQDFTSEGAYCTIIKQRDGRYTVEGVFLKPN
jgi:hypothetical protein